MKIKGLLKLNSRMTSTVTSAEVRTLENRSAISFFSATYTRFHTFCSLLDSFLDFRCVNYASLFSQILCFFLIDQALSLASTVCLFLLCQFYYKYNTDAPNVPCFLFK